MISQPQTSATEVSASQRVQESGQVLVPLLIVAAYFMVTVNVGYTIYLDDEQRFLKAIHDRTLAFFPGYIGFLGTAKVLMRFMPPGPSLQVISASFGAMSVLVFWAWLRTLRLAGPFMALGVLSFANSVYHLYNSSVGTTYTVEAFAFLAVGLFCYQAPQQPSRLYWAAVVLAGAGVFRQSTPFFLLPVFLYSCHRTREYKAAILAAVLSLTWLIPTLVHFGGAKSTLSAGAEQINDAVLPSTLLKGVKLAGSNVIRFIFYVFYGAHIMLAASVFAMRKFELLWIGPAVLFYAFFYVAWPGYILGILAVVYLLGVRWMAHLPKGWAMVAITAVCGINLLQFFVAQPMHDPSSTASAVASTYGFQYSKAGIDRRYQARLRDVLARMPRH